MGSRCCVYGCKHSSYNHSPSGISFHRFPSAKNLAIQKQWMAKTGVSPSEITKYTTVCSAHFKKEDYIKPLANNGTRSMLRIYPHAVPSIFPPLLNEVKDWRSNANFDESPEDMKENVEMMDEENVSNSFHSETFLINVNWYQQEIANLRQQLAAANFELESRKQSNELSVLKNPSDKLTRKFLTFDIIKNDGDLIEFYTGFENEAAYSAFLRHIKTRAKRNVKIKLNGDDTLSKKDSFFLTLIRLKMGFPAVELARIFGISVDSVDRVFTVWINFLNYELRNLLPNLSFEGLTQRKPDKKITESTLMVDCIEIQTSSACGRFNYTAKALVAVTLEGSVCFVSYVEGESASFRTIVSKSGFLNYLRAGQSLITDKDSEIADLLPPGICINNSAPNLNDIIQKVKSNRILDGCMPIAFIDINPILDGCSPSPLTAPTESDPILEGRLPFPLEIWEKSIAVCAMLINFKRA